jgi:predicted RNA binding protein YcfA (HicA-like mRNA interferase family)
MRLPTRTPRRTEAGGQHGWKREGWEVRHGGNHDVYKHPSKPGRIVVARHRTMSIGVARAIARTAGWCD